MKVGYIRVSTQEQNTIRQEVLMQALDVEQVFIDRMSGKNLARPELQKLLAFVRTGDCVIVESISRFARNTKRAASRRWKRKTNRTRRANPSTRLARRPVLKRTTILSVRLCPS